MKKILLILIFNLFFSFSLNADDSVHIGVDLGYGFFDLKAGETAQVIANLSGSTVTYTYDEATVAGRAYVDFEVSDGILAEIGYFQSSDMTATYTIVNSASESYYVSGFDVSAVFKPEEQGFFFKGGFHASELSGEASVTIDGTTFNIASESANGIGYLIGGGYDFVDNYRVGYTFYTSMGGIADADVGFLYLGYRF